jgi:predicted hotdog family 3-hydroxylacyl-ACP dehydratase
MSSGFPLSPPLDHAWIAAHIPHSGSMCLLDQVVEWDAERIR